MIVAEKDKDLGGTTVWSGGWIWVPGNPVCARTGTKDSRQDVETHLRAVPGGQYDPARIDAFLTHAPRMVDVFDSQTTLKFDSGSPIPDTCSDLPGAGQGGRSVIAKPYDGRALGPLIRLLRPPCAKPAFGACPFRPALICAPS